MLYNNLPVYKANIEDEGTGMFICSLVDSPAIEENFLAFGKQEQLTLSIQNEEKRMVLGAVMIPDKPIYRVTPEGKEYYVVFDAPTIHQMQERFMAQYCPNSVDVNHNFEIVEGVFMTQCFFKNEANGVSPKGFEDLPDDTLFFQYHIVNDELWEKCKKGELCGFSLAGNFGLESTIELNKIENTNKTMSKLKKVKELLRAVLQEFANVSTDKGLLTYASDGEIPLIDEEVYLVRENGSEEKPEDGEYKLESKDILVIENGKVKELIKYVPEQEGVVPAPVVEEKEEEFACGDKKEKEVKMEEEVVEEVVEEVAPVEDERDAKIKALEAEIAEKVAEIESEKAEIEELKARIAELEKKPAEKPAEDTFREVTAVKSTGDKKLNNLQRIIYAK